MNGGSFIIPPEFKDKVIEFVDKLNLIHQRERHWYWRLYYWLFKTNHF